MFSLVVETRIDHGLVPLTSLSRGSGSLAPSIASTVSTFQVDPGNGELVELPGTLYSRVTLSGASDSRLLLETGSYQIEDVSLDWQGAEIAIFADHLQGELSIHGTVSPWTISGEDGSARFGGMKIDADQRMTAYGFNVGPFAVAIDTITVEEAPNKVTIGSFQINGDSAIDGGLLNSSGALHVDDITVPGFGEVAIAMDASLERFDAAAFGAVIRAFQRAQAASDPEKALQTIYPTIEADLKKLVTAGAAIKINRLDVTLPQGTIASSLAIDVPESDPDADFSWPGAFLAMTASMDLRIPAEVYDLATMMNPQAGSLLAMGLLQREGDDYVMKAEYAQGLVNVNGAPMPIPIPGM
jgi:uncharacterized protein YdgA (DUF945 family)